MPPQLKNLDDIDISDSFSSTLSGEDFLVRDSIAPSRLSRPFFVNCIQSMLLSE
ncbi:16547_t:CDS:2 [Dentiscutata erythropus]|uniref:16547_t:CDS:1 n=1 Tax=Dentiscutata erythropus TaxID=1348616 RepID=A0A9N9EX75_9GLOM|nr:16547_t:CDS:2 [Dentiscutata erythropus]